MSSGGGGVSKDVGFPERRESRAGENGPIPGESRHKRQKELHLEMVTKPRGGCFVPSRGRAGALSRAALGMTREGTESSSEGEALAGTGTRPGQWRPGGR